ncbi:hypothetical protein ACP4OV_022134 [Aristida adscensionis]
MVTTRQMASRQGRGGNRSRLSAARNAEAAVQRTPPHLLKQQKGKHSNMKESASPSHPVSGSSINHTGLSNGRDNLGSGPICVGGSSSLPQNHSHSIYAGIVEQEEQTKRAYLPAFLSTATQNSTTSRSVYKTGTPGTSDNPSEQLRSLLGGNRVGGSGSGKQDCQFPLHLSNFYPSVPHTYGNNNWNHFQHQQLGQHHHFQHQQLGQHHHFQHQQLEQLPWPLLPSLSSQNTSHNNISNTAGTRATSSSVLGKRRAQSFLQPPPPLNAGDDHTVVLARGPQRRINTDELLNLVQSARTPELLSNYGNSFRPGGSHKPPPAPPLHAGVDTALALGPQCRLETDELLNLVQSIGTPEFLANSEKLLRSGSSLYDEPPRHGVASSLASAYSSSAMSAPSLALGLGNGGCDDKGKGKEVRSYWDLSAMADTMEFMTKKRLEGSSKKPALTLGLDGQGSSKKPALRLGLDGQGSSKDTIQRQPWN